MENTKINCNILIIADGDIPSLYLTILHPLNLLRETHNINYTVKYAKDVFGQSINVLDAYNLIIFVRITFVEIFKKEALYALNKQIPVIYILDDDLATLHAHAEAKYRYGEVIRNFIQLATTTIVTTEYLYNKYKAWSNNIKIINGHIDLELFKSFNIVKNYTNPILRIGYASNDHNYANLKIALPALVNILKKYPNVSLEIFYKKLPSELVNFPNVQRFNPIPNLTDYYKFAASRNWDVGIAPLSDTEFNRAKSNNKYREYATLKVPGIYSDIAPYHFITNNGIICKDGDWEVALNSLLTNPIKRQEIADIAFNHVSQMYSKETVSSTFVSIFKNCLRLP